MKILLRDHMGQMGPCLGLLQDLPGHNYQREFASKTHVELTSSPSGFWVWDGAGHQFPGKGCSLNAR